MGFQRPRTTYRLKFAEGSDLVGFEVAVRGMTVGELEDIMSMSDVAGADDEDGRTALRGLMDRLIGDPEQGIEPAIVRWNLEDEHGTPIAPSREVLRQFEVPHLLGIVDAWTSAILSVAPPLPTNSPGGSTARVAQLPMELPSPSHPLLRVHE